MAIVKCQDEQAGQLVHHGTLHVDIVCPDLMLDIWIR